MDIAAKHKELQDLLKGYDTCALLKAIAFLFTRMEDRHSFPMLQGLHSPLRQLLFCADLSVRTRKNSGKLKMAAFYPTWEKDWEQIKQLLIEIESAYFPAMVAAVTNDKDRDKILVTGPTFMNYFFNGNLSYPEQDIERIERTFENNKETLTAKTGLSAKDLISLYDSILNATSNKLQTLAKIKDNEAFIKFNRTDGKNGKPDLDKLPEAAREEVVAFINFMKDPGNLFVVTPREIDPNNLDKAKQMLNFLACSQGEESDIIWYTSPCQFMSKPIFRSSEEEYIIINNKQVLSAAYETLLESLVAEDATGTYRQRDKLLESKSLEILQRFFGKKAHYYTSYSVDQISEQDILVLHGDTALIVEAKAAGFREPMRDPNKAYEKIKSDFKSIIQYGYNQTWRVKEKFLSGNSFVVYNQKKEFLYKIDPKKYNKVYSVIVTLERFGVVQSDLALLLNLQDDDEYPWSVCVDDLEIFLLSLRCRSKGTAEFTNFLEYRQFLHGHLICNDELEVCAYSMLNFQKFREQSIGDDIVVPDPRLTEFFETFYKAGIGFTNERHWKMKKEGTLGYL